METVTGTTPGFFDVENGGGSGIGSGGSSGGGILHSGRRILCGSCESRWYGAYARVSIFQGGTLEITTRQRCCAVQNVSHCLHLCAAPEMAAI